MEIYNLNEKNAVQVSLYYQRNPILKRTLVGVRTQGKSKVKLRNICRDIAQHSAYDTEELYAMVRRVMNHAREELVCGNVVEFDDYFTLRPEVHAHTKNITRIEEFTSSNITGVGTQVKLNSSFADLTNEVRGVVVNVTRNDQSESVEQMKSSLPSPDATTGSGTGDVSANDNTSSNPQSGSNPNTNGGNTNGGSSNPNPNPPQGGYDGD